MRKSPRPSRNWREIDIILKGVEDAKKALRLILSRTEISKTPDYAG